MSEHASALEAAMKAGGFDPLNNVARKAVEDAIAAYLSERVGEADGWPVEGPSPSSHVPVEQAADAYVAEKGIEHSGGIIEASFEAGARWANESGD